MGISTFYLNVWYTARTVNTNLNSHIKLFLQHVSALSGGAVMDNVFYLTIAVMETKTVVMAVMN